MLVFVVGLYCGPALATDSEDQEIVDFFQTVEESFKKMYLSAIMKNIHKDFSYIMTYSTDGHFSYLVSDRKKYRESLGSFFNSKPLISEYVIVVEDIQRSGDDIMVLARIKSIVKLNGIVNACDASSNYFVQKVNSAFLIRDVRGDATCFNSNPKED